MKVKIYGFTLLRNGIKYDYPFRECLSALTAFCEESYIALGDSDDNTEKEVRSFNSLKCLPTKWDMSLMGDGGKILSQQTNIALQKLRKEKMCEEASWGFYLQTDELIHEKDFEQIRNDIQVAQEQGYDAVRFRYYHFWLNHNEIAISKRWYPQEVRAIKLNSAIMSHGDAQGFNHCKKIFESEVHIFHYGHVRDKEKREAKQELLIKMIRPNQKFQKYKAREEKSFKNTETLHYLGTHPKWMKERIKKFNDIFSALPVNEVLLYDPRAIISDNLKDRIVAKKVTITSKKEKRSLSLEPHFLEKIGLRKSIPKAMRSPIARPWSEERRMEFILWANGVSTL
jgi:hypothetical protein